ncbi:adenosylcobinamide-GDP ribazoletransferase [Halorussus marinus]|uniref:adenosylcobinamide-GDP ribazoletransferase n=1 Tax=Halorussus marinus TaxID=2505976 RepID=UPI001FCE88DD|nr:adenosylcobinamide-GDP ribazoletransferase [Halorussus marinus]
MALNEGSLAERHLTALRGALGFLTRAPVGHDERAWDAFRATPAAFPAVGWIVGAVAAGPLLVGVPAPTAAFGYLLALYAITGINHADGVADLGDAAVVHGGPEKRRAVLKDTEVGVGALLALGVVLVGVALAGLALARRPPAGAFGVVVAAEVGAKLGMASLACLGRPAHEGLGSAFARHPPARLAGPAVVAAPVALLGAPAIAAVLGALGAAFGVRRWFDATLGGISGDAFGAANELGRLAGLHLGVIAWTLS